MINNTELENKDALSLVIQEGLNLLIYLLSSLSLHISKITEWELNLAKVNRDTLRVLHEFNKLSIGS